MYVGMYVISTNSVELMNDSKIKFHALLTEPARCPSNNYNIFIHFRIFILFTKYLL